MAVLGCATGALGREGDAPGVPEPGSSIVASGVTAWDFLREKYDADQDGRVAREEYGRSDEAFARLDGSQDGTLSPEDFDERGEEFARARVAQKARRAVARLFQSDEDPAVLHRGEIEASFSSLDRNEDGLLEPTELAPDPGGRGGRRRGSRARLKESLAVQALLESADTGRDGALSREEILSLFDSFDPEKTGRWEREDMREDPREVGDETDADSRVYATEGAQAPDFSLAPLYGGAPVRLSSFIGTRPVALIFGSFT